MISKEEAMPLVLEATERSLGPIYKIAKLSGTSYRTVLRWLLASSQNPNEWLVDYDGERMPFHRAFKIAQLTVPMAARAKALNLIQDGEEVPMFLDGLPVWKVDPELAAHALNPDMWALLYGDRLITDIYMRDDKGRLIQETQKLATNANLFSKVLTALDPDFADRRSVDVQHRGGVLVVGAPAQQQQPQPVQLEHKVVKEAEFREIEPDAVTVDDDGNLVPTRKNRASEKPAHALNGSGADNPSAETIEEFSSEEPEADAMTEDEKMQPQPGDSAMVVDLKARYWSNRERINGGDVPTAPAPVAVMPAVDDDAERAQPMPKAAASALDEQVQAILSKKSRGEALTAIERQAVSGYERGNLKYVASLLTHRNVEGIGSDSAETVKPGGYKVQ
jgi:hypothetical protein